MIIVKFYSGLGNQLYQYAVYLNVLERYPNEIVKADLSTFDADEILNGGNGFSYGFALHDIFGVDLCKASREEIKRCNYEFVFSKFWVRHFPKLVKKCIGNSKAADLRSKLLKTYKNKKEHFVTNSPFNLYNGNIYNLDLSNDYYVSGLWQNYEYISRVESNLREKLRFQNNISEKFNGIYKMIEQSNSVCIHVRRGNFAIPENRFTHDICGYDYYSSALKLIEEKVTAPQYFIFSDDIKYAQEMFASLSNVTYVSGLKDMKLEDEMILIGACKNAIIPNSTFAFWCVWLGDNNNKTVICPKYAVRRQNSWNEFSVPNRWIQLNNLATYEH